MYVSAVDVWFWVAYREESVAGTTAFQINKQEWFLVRRDSLASFGRVPAAAFWIYGKDTEPHRLRGNRCCSAWSAVDKLSLATVGRWERACLGAILPTVEIPVAATECVEGIVFSSFNNASLLKE